MVVTMVEGEIEPSREADLLAAYRATIAGGLGEQLIETFLLHEDGSPRWRIVTVWRSRADLEELRGSGVTPPAMMIFRAAGVDQPRLSIFEVAEQASQ